MRKFKFKFLIIIFLFSLVSKSCNLITQSQENSLFISLSETVFKNIIEKTFNVKYDIQKDSVFLSKKITRDKLIKAVGDSTILDKATDAGIFLFTTEKRYNKLVWDYDKENKIYEIYFLAIKHPKIQEIDKY